MGEEAKQRLLQARMAAAQQTRVSRAGYRDRIDDQRRYEASIRVRVAESVRESRHGVSDAQLDEVEAYLRACASPVAAQYVQMAPSEHAFWDAWQDHDGEGRLQLDYYQHGHADGQAEQHYYMA